MNLAYPTPPTARLVQGFGNHNPRLYPGTGRHMGVDLAANVGTPIYAACPGVVEVVNLKGAHGYGRHVILGHGDFRTLYAHLHKVIVKEGDAIEAGAGIGEMGGDPTDDDPIDGASSGPHLHFELILSAEPKLDFIKTILGWTVDPFRYLLDRFAPPPQKIGTVTETRGLRVRLSAGTTARDTIIDALQKNTRFEVAELKDDDGNTQWARLHSLRPEWACVKYQGRKYAELEEVSGGLDTPVSTPATRPTEAEERNIRLDEVRAMIVALQVRAKELE